MAQAWSRCATLLAGLALVASAAAPAPAQLQLATHTPSVAPLSVTVEADPGVKLKEVPGLISLHFTDASLDEVLTEIGRQTGLRLMYGEDVLSSPLRVTVRLEGATLQQTLLAALGGTGLMVRPISEEALLIKRGEPEVRLRARQGTVTGRVVDAATLQPLSGASVSVVGTTRGSLSGSDGRYSITSVPDGSQQVRATMIGYAQQQQGVTVTNGGVATADFALEASAVELEGIVAVGYMTERERNVSGAITTVRVEDLDPISTTSVNQLLRGKAPGLNLTTRSAQPGGGVTANIRGDISPLGTATPLYVIDGVPITEYQSSQPRLIDGDLGFYGGVDRDPLAYLNPADLESITILKDASATAIYGSAAANGVVLITTKSGRAGAVQMQYSGSYTMERLHDYFPLMNAREFMQEQSRLAYDRYLYENRLAPYGTRDPSTAPAYTPLFTPGDIAQAGTGTDWLDLVTEDGHAQEHNVTFRGGSDNTRVYSSFNFRGNDAILRGSSLNRYTGRLNLDQNVSDRVRFSLRMSAARLEGDNASTGSNAGGPEKFNMLQAAYGYAPTVPIYDENGDYAYSYYRTVMNPAAFLTIDDNSRTTTLFAAPNFEVDFTDDLKGTVIGQVNQESSTRNFYLPRTTNNDPLPDGMAQKGEQSVFNYSAESYLTYANSFGESELSVVGGAGFYKAESEGSAMQGIGFFTDAFGYNNIGVSSDKLRNTIDSFRTSRTKLSQFGRVNYTLRNRYILSLVARRDGSSIFAENHKYGIFPGISAAWILSEEAFMDRLPSFSQLKVRVGYGIAGNESVLSGNTLQLYSPGYPFLIGNTEFDGVTLSQVANPFLTWEKTSTLNLGVDFGLWSQRVSGSVDYYVKTARDLLDFNTLPANNAVGRVADNVGATRSRGVELSISTQNIQTDQIDWSTDFNVSRYRGYWLERNPQVALAPYVEEHAALDAIYGWETDGIIRSEADRPVHMPDANLGNLRYVDQNGDGELDQMDVIILGNSTPRWNVGLGNRLGIGNFDLSVFAYGALDYLRGNTYAPNIFDISQAITPSNTTINSREIWSVDNPDGTRPGVAANPHNADNPAGTDFNLHDASFLRLSNVTLGYRLPETLIQRLGSTRSARLYVDLRNLGVLSDYPGFDPEYTEANPYPKYYSTTVGVEIDF
ncbi:MAG TPA: SusC/RagA family TonB-linked outer membrane protein [Longimicrobiaceae bacterium]